MPGISKGLLAGLLFMASTTAHAACTVTLQGPSGSQYSSTNLSAFVETEIRPKLSASPGSFQINLKKDCGSGTPTSVDLTIDQTDYYITKLNDHVLSDQESVYRTSDVNLDRPHFETAIDDAANADNIGLDRVQNAVKTLAFYMAETSRFAAIETIGVSILRDGCSAHWISYATLVRRWSVLSHFDEKKGILGWTARGGHSGQLLAPVVADVIDQYNQAIGAGDGGPDYKLVDRRDYGHPIDVPWATCPAR